MIYAVRPRSSLFASSSKADITGEVFSGYVRIKFKKGKTNGINLYSRIKGQTVWKFVSRDTNSPYDDHTPLAVSGTPRSASIKPSAY